MKRTILILKLIWGALFLALTILSFSPQISYADAPKDVTIKYNSGSQTLSVTITHKSAFTRMHHIKTVEIKKNNAVVSTTNYDTQPKEVPFSYTYKMEAAPGDKLDVTVACNISGSRTASLTVPAAGNAGK
jgi:desulfoferrodoxin (superoxide reductase-like protein)